MHIATVAGGSVAFPALGSGAVIANLIFGAVLILGVALIAIFEVRAVEA